jgi:hypothetical protein
MLVEEYPWLQERELWCSMMVWCSWGLGGGTTKTACVERTCRKGSWKMWSEMSFRPTNQSNSRWNALFSFLQLPLLLREVFSPNVGSPPPSSLLPLLHSRFLPLKDSLYSRLIWHLLGGEGNRRSEKGRVFWTVLPSGHLLRSARCPVLGRVVPLFEIFESEWSNAQSSSFIHHHEESSFISTGIPVPYVPVRLSTLD